MPKATDSKNNISTEEIREVIVGLYQKYKDLNSGVLATYIPELALANPKHFAISVTLATGETVSIGDVDEEFSLQSISKPFIYGLALKELGKEFVLTKVGVEPSGEAFNSIVELEKTTHLPYNPMINSGAIAISSLLEGGDPARNLKKVIQFLNQFAGRNLHVDTATFLSEKATAHRNRSIAHLLKHFGVITGDIDAALDLYFQQCSVLVNAKDLGEMAATLANLGTQPNSKIEVLSPNQVRDVLSLMFSCGMYDSAGEWAYNVGLPAKSGVSGGLIAVAPRKLGIAVYSPLIDAKGHSERGLRVIHDFAEALKLNVFMGND